MDGLGYLGFVAAMFAGSWLIWRELHPPRPSTRIAGWVRFTRACERMTRHDL